MTSRSLRTRFSARLGVAAVAVATTSALVVPVASAAPATSPSETTTTAPDAGLPDTGLPEEPAGSLEDGRLVGSLVGTDWAAVARVAAALATGTPNLTTVVDLASLIMNSPLTWDDIAGSVEGSAAGSSSLGSSSAPEDPADPADPAGDDAADSGTPAEAGAPVAE